jgi:hypothetical protein
MKIETFNAISKSHKRCILEVFMMISVWALVHYGPLCALRPLLAPSVVGKNMSSLDLICFSPIDRVISLVIRKKKAVLLSKRFPML